MKKHKLGNSGLEIVPLALGGNVFGWTADEPTSFRLLDAFKPSSGIWTGSPKISCSG